MSDNQDMSDHVVQLSEAMSIMRTKDVQHLINRIKELEAKLAKAVKALDKIKRTDNLVGVFAACERTIAELNGETE